jgi:hypothetical protein
MKKLQAGLLALMLVVALHPLAACNRKRSAATTPTADKSPDGPLFQRGLAAGLGILTLMIVCCSE